MKIAMVTSWQTACGIADYAQALVEALKKVPGVEVDVLALEKGRTDPGHFQALGRACNAYDLVHIQHEYVFFGGRDPWHRQWQDMIRQIKVPYVVTVHTWLRPFTGGPWYKRLLRTLRNGLYRIIGWQDYLETGQFRGAEKIHVHTQAFAEAFRNKGVDPGQLVVFPQGIPGPRQDADGERARRQWGLKRRIVMLFGFLIPAKGHLLALEAWRQAPAETDLVIVGKTFSKTDESYAQAVREAAAAFPESVRMTGYLEEDALADMLKAADLVLLPYTHGTSSYALSLVMAYGRAVLTSDIGCFRELKTAGDMLEIFPRHRPDILAGQIRRLLDDAPRLAQLRANAAEWAASHSWEAIASGLADVYTEIMQKTTGKHH